MALVRVPYVSRAELPEGGRGGRTTCGYSSTVTSKVQLGIGDSPPAGQRHEGTKNTLALGILSVGCDSVLVLLMLQSSGQGSEMASDDALMPPLNKRPQAAEPR